MGQRTWVPTFSGVKFYPLDPRPEDVRIIDIAHHLSNIARFVGATGQQYTVGQHSLLVSQYIELVGGSLEEILWGLLHDAGEAYIGDLTRGIKYKFPEFMEIEEGILKVVAQVFNLPWPQPKIVTEWDNIIGDNEAIQLLPHASEEYFGIEVIPKVTLENRPNEIVEVVFLSRFDKLQTLLNGGKAK